MTSNSDVTILVPGAFARAWDAAHADDNCALDAVRRDLAAAWSSATVRKTGGGTVRILLLSRPLARHFADSVEYLVEVKSGKYGIEGVDRVAAAAGRKLLERLDDLGIDSRDAVRYTMTDPAPPATADAEEGLG